MKYLPIDATSSHNANLNVLWQHSWKLYRLGVGIYGRYQSTRRYINDNNANGFQTWRINTALIIKNETVVINDECRDR